MQVSALSRIFEFAGVRIPDPDRTLSPEEVRSVLAPLYPDIATATVSGPEVKGDKLVFTLSRSVGVKG
jgi:PRTRC genetic system protein C